MSAEQVYRLRLERARLLEQADALIESAKAHAAALEQLAAHALPEDRAPARALAAPLPRSAVDDALSMANLAALGLDEALTTRATGGAA